MLGGAYTDARVPLDFQLADLLDLRRNPYDKIGHFFQGFVPALVAREMLIRSAFVQGRRMLAFLVVCVVLAISATYELIEWAVAVLLGQGVDDFLGTQGDHPWDTQSDLFFALIGAITALVLFSRLRIGNVDNDRILSDRINRNTSSALVHHERFLPTHRRESVASTHMGIA